jgi:hypothetical protein
MQISDTELKKLMHAGSAKLSPAIVEQLGNPNPNDEALIKALTHDIINMPDREDRVAEMQVSTSQPAKRLPKQCGDAQSLIA